MRVVISTIANHIASWSWLEVEKVGYMHDSGVSHNLGLSALNREASIPRIPQFLAIPGFRDPENLLSLSTLF